ncbi:MAG TPA: hypothetical protein VFS23_41865, partial [Vicinamibacterales bacterium]|nr:hypothetical protein [Vicinamibacterales bacterium]
MTSCFVRSVCVVALALCAAITGHAQSPASSAPAPDPRVGLTPGFRNAGEAARNMQLVATLPKPDGFFDPKAPAGPPLPPDQPEKPGAPETGDTETTPERPDGQPAQAGAPPSINSQISFANSDLAFSGDLMFVGSFHGYSIYDIENGAKPRLLSSVVCPGGQGDVSVYRHLLIVSVEQTRGRVDCGTGGVKDTVSPERFRGIRIFDISDLRQPRQVAAVQTCRGSHTHTLVTDPRNRDRLYVYVSGTGVVRSGDELAGCSGKDPKEDPNTSLFSIDVIEIPVTAPERARIVSQPRIFADTATGALAGLWQGGNHGPGTQSSRMTRQCHDITVFPEVGLAAGACAGNGLLLDISDPVNPVRLDAVTDKSFAYWHSATFSLDGSRVIFTDEWGGGTRPRCRAMDPITWGANAVFDVVDRKLRFAGYYKMPAAQSELENCVAHNGSVIPVPGRDIMVQAWYQGGVSVFDFSDAANPVEIAFFDRGPLDAKELILGGYWSAYWYNGHIYGSEISRGMDVFTLTPSEFLSKNEIEAATLASAADLNVQQQRRVTWPSSSVVALAYVDQLMRNRAIQPASADAIRATLERADRIRNSRQRGAAGIVSQLDALATQVDRDAKAASGRDAARLQALAATLRGR